MMSPRVMEIDREWAAAKVAEWGYPRRVSADERERSKWFAYGASVIFWFDQCLPCEVALHLIVEPRARGRLGLYVLKLVVAWDVIAELMNAARIIAWLPPGDHIEGLVSRLGWSLLDPTVAGPGRRAWVRHLPTIEIEEDDSGIVEPTAEAKARA